MGCINNYRFRSALSEVPKLLQYIVKHVTAPYNQTSRVKKHLRGGRAFHSGREGFFYKETVEFKRALNHLQQVEQSAQRQL